MWLLNHNELMAIRHSRHTDVQDWFGARKCVPNSFDMHLFGPLEDYCPKVRSAEQSPSALQETVTT